MHISDRFNIWLAKYFSDDAAITLALVLLVSVFILFTIGDLLAPVFGGLVFAYWLQGIVDTLERAKLPHLLAVISTFLLFITLIACIIFMILPSIFGQMSHFFSDLPTMTERLKIILAELPNKYPEFISIQHIQIVTEAIREQTGSLGNWIVSFSLGRLIDVVTLLVYVVLVPIFIFFFLKDRQLLMEAFIALMPKNRRLINQLVVEMNIQISKYIQGKVFEIFIVGVVDYLLFLYFDLKYALLLSVLVGLSVIVPYIGTVVVTVPIALVALLQFGITSDFMALIGIYSSIQLIDAYILVPLLFGEAVDVHPVGIILAVLIFGGLWGFWGVFFAIPLATLIKAVAHVWPTQQVSHGIIV
ncbi:MAG: AI-2E family transporter [Endozoicomonadaceae bacterium]|nr:AI-2E family transporter [Endozoicomonadaceae bacterium]